MSKSQQICEYCSKSYTRKLSYIKHTILCEVFHKSKREKICEKEESTGIPSTKELYGIIQELALKYKILEEKMEDMHKWVDKKKKKLNVIQWLNVNVTPKITYTDWIQSLKASEEEVEILIEKSMTLTVDSIFSKNLQDKPNHAYPIYCFIQKANIFYIFDDSIKEWRQMKPEELITLSKKVHSKILTAMCEWYKKNTREIIQNDKMSILYNKTMIKLMSSEFTIDSMYLSKMKASIYNYLKTDLTNIVEYDFEF